MKSGFAPALVMFAAAAAGALAMRDIATKKAAAEETRASVAAVTTAPDPVDTVGGRSAQLRKEADGHYWTMAYVNGIPTRFMVDTGASVVALTERDARRIGLKLEELPRNADISTASGHVKALTATLDTVKIDRVEVSGVSAVIIDKGLEHSLLGMSFLNGTKGWTATPTAIVVRQ